MTKQQPLIRAAAARRPRLVNLTMIDDTGAPCTTQIRDSVGCDGAAMDYLVKRVKAALGHTWYRPVIYAFMYDTQLKELRRYSVSGSKIDRITTSL